MEDELDQMFKDRKELYRSLFLHFKQYAIHLHGLSTRLKFSPFSRKLVELKGDSSEDGVLRSKFVLGMLKAIGRKVRFYLFSFLITKLRFLGLCQFCSTSSSCGPWWTSSTLCSRLARTARRSPQKSKPLPLTTKPPTTNSPLFQLCDLPFAIKSL